MEEKLVLWLDNSGPVWVLENLRILSNNGLHITCKSLRELFIEVESISSTTIKYGLNKEQLLLLQESIEPTILKCGDNKQHDYVYHYSHRYFYEYIEGISDYIVDEINPKPILLMDIIRNNKKHLISTSTIQPIATTTITSYAQDNSILFFKIWRNLVIKSNIMNYYSIIRNHYCKFKFSSIMELDNYRYKHYLRNVEVVFPVSEEEAKEIQGEMINDYLQFKLPSSIEILRMTGIYNKEIKINSIPSTITSLQFNQDYYQDVKYIDLNIPLGNDCFNKLDFRGVKKLKFNSLFRSQIYTGSIPEGIENISFESNWYYRFSFKSNLLPSTLKTLYLGSQIGERTDKCIDVIPNGITKLKYGCNMELTSKSFPNSIINLNITNSSDLLFKKGKSIGKGVLPEGLKILKINYPNQFQHGILPPTLVILKLPDNQFTTFLPGVLPETLEYLSFQNYEKNLHQGVNKITELLKTFKSSIQPCLIKGSLPVSLKTLKLSPYINHMDTLIKPVLKQCINLTKLSITATHATDYKFKNKKQIKDPLTKSIEWSNHLKYIPSSVTQIKCISTYEYPHFIHSIPITHFEFTPSKHGYPTDLQYKLFGNTITSFTFSNLFNGSISLDLLPDNLIILNFGYYYNQPIPPQLLPQSLTSLSFLKCKHVNKYSKFKFQSQFNQSLNSTNIPIGLKHLSLGSSFTQPIDIDAVFPNLVTLFIGNSNPTSFIFNSLKSPNLKHIIVINTNIEFLNSNINLDQSILKVIDCHPLKHGRNLGEMASVIQTDLIDQYHIPITLWLI